MEGIDFCWVGRRKRSPTNRQRAHPTIADSTEIWVTFNPGDDQPTSVLSPARHRRGRDRRRQLAR